jgi:hypothetical protein
VSPEKLDKQTGLAYLAMPEHGQPATGTLTSVPNQGIEFLELAPPIEKLRASDWGRGFRAHRTDSYKWI